MTSKTLSWMPLVLIAAAVTLSAAASSAVPTPVLLPLDGMLPLDASTSDGAVPKWLALYSMPVLAVAIWALFRSFPTRGGERLARAMFHDAPERVTSAEQLRRIGKTYDTIVLGVVVLILGLHVGALAAALGAPEIAVRVVPAVAGAGLVMMGNVFPRLRPNWVAGIRTKRTLSDADLWRSTHRAFGAAFVVAGLVTMTVGLVAPRWGLIVGLGSLLLACIVGFVASRTRGVATIGAAPSSSSHTNGSGS